MAFFADDENKYLLFNYVMYFYNHAPIGSWGSPDCFDAWVARGGDRGKRQ